MSEVLHNRSDTNRFPFLFLKVGTLITAIVLCWLAWSTYRSYQVIYRIHENYYTIGELEGVIKHLDEVLTMSAQMAVETGLPEWQIRYREAEPQLEKAIKETLRLAPDAYTGEGAVQIDAANVRLLEMEEQALALVNQNRAAEARAVLTSVDYRTQKQIYADGMSRVAARLEQGFHGVLESEQRRAFYTSISALALLPVLSLLLLIVYRSIHSWRLCLSTSNTELDRKAQELIDLNAHLDARVRERTVELEESFLKLKAAESALEDTNRNLNAIFEATTQVLIVATDPAGLITVVNRGAERMLGYSAEELIGKATPRGFHRDSAEFDMVLQEMTRKGSFDTEATLVRKDGSSLPVSLGLTTLRDAAGRPVGILGIATDITPQKRIEEELKAAAQMKSDFVSFATHQLRTPLTGIRWLLELALQDHEMSADSTALINDGYQSAERLIKMVNDLLDLSRLEGGRYNLLPVNTNIVDLTRNVLKDVTPQIEQQKHELIFVPDETAPVVRVDPGAFRQVLLNLLSNAIKYTPPGGRIEISVGQKEGRVLWSVKDNGIGIPKECSARMFEKFFRADNVSKVETEGTGLGLCIVRLVVEQSGGHVWFESEEGKGSTFTLEIPAAAIATSRVA